MVTHPHLLRRREVHYLRRPHTLNELRQAQIDFSTEEELDLPSNLVYACRSRAKRRNLPTEWDDKPVSLWKNSEFVRRWQAMRNH